MKKITLTFAFALIALSFSFGQNIGFVFGTGTGNLKFKSSEQQLVDSFPYSAPVTTYRGGVSFEQILIEKQLYLQLTLAAAGRGGKTDDAKAGYFLHYGDIALDVKYKLHMDLDELYNVYFSAGGYIGGGFSGKKWDEDAEADTTINFNPVVVFGKDIDHDFDPIDFGLNFGIGFGLQKFQIGYKFGLGLANIQTESLTNFLNDIDITSKLSHMTHELVLGFYFTNK